jgi:hypothetical protein
MNSKLFKNLTVIVILITFFHVASAAGVPINWNQDRLRSEIRDKELKYEDYFFGGTDPNSPFMLRQQAAIDAMRARLYDLEFTDAMGFLPPNPSYHPDDFTPQNYIPRGHVTERTPYDWNPRPQRGVQNNTNNTTNNRTNNDTGRSDDPYYGGYDQNLASQTGQEESWGSKTQHQGEPFGGLVVARMECTCEMPNYIVFLQDFTSQSLKILKVDTSYSKMYQFYDLNVGQYGVGTYDMNAICRIRVGMDCIPFNVDGVINRGPGAGSSGVI